MSYVYVPFVKQTYCRLLVLAIMPETISFNLEWRILSTPKHSKVLSAQNLQKQCTTNSTTEKDYT